MGRTLELFELESNPAGKLSVTMSKGPLYHRDSGLGPCRNYPESSRAGCDSWL